MREKTEDFKISKEQSAVIKGVAILLMLIHHGFTFPQWITDGVYQPNPIFAAYFNAPTRLCVGLFAFVTGWAYALKDRHSIQESKTKIIKFLCTYWIVCVPALIFAGACGGYRPNAIGIMTELLGLSNDVMKFCWYVPFYIMAMALLPCLYLLWNQSLAKGIITGMIIPIAAFIGLESLLKGTVFQMLFNSLKHWFPCITVGYLCKRYDLFSVAWKKTSRIPPTLLCLTGTVFCGVGRFLLPAFDFAYCAIMVFSIVNCTRTRDGLLIKALGSLGNMAANIWFLHCLIFNPYTGHIFQAVFYRSNNPLVIMAGLVATLYLSSFWVTKLDTTVIQFVCKGTSE